MSEKKHIDRLFQEKLKDFEVAPNDSVWDNIHSQLHKEDEGNRKVIPFWWKLAGVAALLILLLTVGIKFMSNDSNSNAHNTVVDTEKQSSDNSSDASQSDANNQKDIKNNSNDFDTKMDNSSNVSNEDGSNSEDIINGISNETVNTNSKKNKNNSNGLNASDANHTGIANNSKNGSNQKQGSETANRYKNPSQDSNANTSKDAIADWVKNDEINSNQNSVSQNKSEIDKHIKDSKSNNNTLETNASEKMEAILAEEKIEEEKTEISIEDAIAESNTEEENDEKEKKLNRWNISPNVAPVYFNSLGKGSSLDEQFVNNTKAGDVTMSYGVGGSYAINDRLKVRAGINKVNMGYSTNNVIAFRNLETSSIQFDASGSFNDTSAHLTNVNVNSNSEDMVFLSTETFNKNITPEIINSKSNGFINQRFGFIEVPLEMEYAVINNRFGVNVIGGFSTFIVDENEIFSVVNGTEMNIGEANNINNMSYSANLGLGVNYNISDKIKVNVEPTFKYQINTFNNSSGDFQPFFIGVYTGLSYKF